MVVVFKVVRLVVPLQVSQVHLPPQIRGEKLKEAQITIHLQQVSFRYQQHLTDPFLFIDWFCLTPTTFQGADPTSDSWDTSNGKHWSANPAFDWIRGAYGAKSTNPNFRFEKDFPTKQILKPDLDLFLFYSLFRSLEEEVNFLRNQRMGDGTISDKLNSSDTNADVVPCEILIHDLTQAKRQLLELHSLVRGVITC